MTRRQSPSCGSAGSFDPYFADATMRGPIFAGIFRF